MHQTNAPAALCFKRWSRRKYAAFASLHQVVKIGVVTCTCSLVQLTYQHAVAQTVDSLAVQGEVELGEVEVTEDRPSVLTPITRSIQSMEQSEIAAAPARSLDDLLEHLPGVDVRQRGTDGIQADLSIRGGTFDQVLILLNGINLTDPQTGHHNLNLPIDLDAVTRIELLQGPGARIHGSQAFSGILNIVTEPSSTTHPSISIQTGAGSFGCRNASISGNNRLGPWLLSYHTAWKKSEGYLENTDFSVWNSHLLLTRTDPRLGRLEFQTGYQQKAFGANGFYSLSYPEQFEATKTLFATAKWEKMWRYTQLSGNLYERLHHDRFELFRNPDEAAPWYTGPNFHLTSVTGLDWKLVQRESFGKTTVGMDLRNEEISSNVLGEPMSVSRPDFFDRFGTFSKSKSRMQTRFFGDQSVYLNSFTLSAGFSANFHSDFTPVILGGMDVRYDLTQNLQLLVNLNQSLRYPTFTDLYYCSATQISNPYLKPERSTTYEATAQFSKNRFHAYASGFFRRGKNIIDWIRQPDSVRWYSRNETVLNAYGGELVAEYRSHRGFLRHARLGWNGLQMDKEARDFDSKYALDYVRRKISMHLEHTLLEHRKLGSLTASWYLSWQDRAGTYLEFGTNRILAYEPFLQADGGISWHRGAFTVKAEGNNLWNSTIVDFGGLPLPGRTFRVQVRVSIPECFPR